MQILVVYDASETKLGKINKFLKKRLTWIQNSVFQGELSDSEFVILTGDLKKMIKDEKEFNSIIIFKWIYGKPDKIIIGKDKNPVTNFI